MNNDFDFLDDVEVDIIEEVKTAAKNPFAKLEESLNLPIGSTIPRNLPKEIKQNTKEAINEVSTILKSDEDSFEDKIFIQDTIKRTIIRVESMLDRIEGELEMGAEPRMYEVYSKMVSSLNESVDKLMNLHKQAEMSGVLKNKPEEEKKQNGVVISQTNNITIDSEKFADFIDSL